MMRLTQIINVGLIPLLIIVAGLIRATRRSQAMRVQAADTTQTSANAAANAVAFAAEDTSVTEKTLEAENETKKENGYDI